MEPYAYLKCRYAKENRIADVTQPMATVIIGGVIVSALFTLLILPLLYILIQPHGKNFPKINQA